MPPFEKGFEVVKSERLKIIGMWLHVIG